MAEDEINDDVAGMEVEVEVEEDEEVKKNDVIDIDRVLDLLKASRKAGDVITKKDVMLLIGLTGAGKVSRRAQC
jgi:flagellar biosynthesis GTPase FlhF